VINLLIDLIKESIRRVERHSEPLISKVRTEVPRLYLDEVPIYTFREAVNMLRSENISQDFNEDLSTENEKALA